MTEVGYASLLVGLVASIYAAAALVVGIRKGYSELVSSGKYAAAGATGTLVLSSSILIWAFLSRDFSIKYVHDYSSRDLPTLYTVSAFWAGQEGSLLFWALILGCFILVVMFQNRDRHKELLPYVLAIMLGVQGFFIAMAALVTNVFARSSVVPADGYGLNPLLQNPGMLFHPTTLYLGYVGVTVPFAFAMAALITGRLSDKWIRSTRHWTLFAWFFLTLGNVFGAQWAYVELGWGGYWAWDPVENASLMPWLVATAYLHSVMIQQRRGMLKVWNIALITITFVLSLFGTFLVRSGILSSVHSFGASSLGTYFLALIGVVLVLSVGLLLDRLPQLRGENEFDSIVSRESSFLLNNLILVGAAFAVFWGTVYPLVSEAVRGQTVSVNAPFFNQVNGPIFLLLIVLMGVCPLIGWRRATTENLIRNFLYPAIAAVVVGIVVYLLGVTEVFAGTLPVAACAFVLATLILEFIRGVRANSRRLGTRNYLWAAGNLVARNRPRYGGYTVHLGIVLLAIGIIGSSTYKLETDVTLGRGESAGIGNYMVKYEGLSSFPTVSKQVYTATLEVRDRDGRLIGAMSPKKSQHRNQEQMHSEAAIRSTFADDFYIILGGWEDNGAKASFKLVVSPLVLWIWIGGVILSAGTMVSMWPDRRESKRLESRYTRELAERGLLGREAVLGEN